MSDRAREVASERRPVSPAGAGALTALAAFVSLWSYTGAVLPGVWTFVLGALIVVIVLTGVLMRLATVRVRAGKTLVSDGPFAESKEWIAGFDLLDCASLDEAIAIASRHPMARFGSIELRPFWPIDVEEDPRARAAREADG